MVKVSRDDLEKWFNLIRQNDTQYILVDTDIDTFYIHMEVGGENATIEMYDCSRSPAPRRATIKKKEFL